MIKEHDIVAMTEDQPTDGLRRGDVGAVVHCYPKGEAFEVEFIDERGKTKCVVTVRSDSVMRLNMLSLSA